MKKTLITLLLALATLATYAQEEEAPAPVVGYMSYTAVLEQMAQYGVLQNEMAALKAKYDAETKRSEDEFNKKYEEFLEGQRDFAPSILQKRQSELEDLMQTNQAFKEQAVKLLKQAEDEKLAVLKTQLNEAVGKVAAEKKLLFVLNTDNNAVPYIDTLRTVDITEAVKAIVAP